MINSIQLSNYRNLTLSTKLAAGANLLVAPNGSGKSNFLESIYMLAANRSFRPQNTYAELIGPDGDFAKVTIDLSGKQLELVVSDVQKLQKKFSLNGKPRPFSKVNGELLAVLFAPHSVDLVSGEPAVRRADLDAHLSMINHNYAKSIKRYNKLLKNRNALLKNIREGFSEVKELKYWTAELMKEVSFIVAARLDFFSEIEPYVKESAEIIYRDGFGELSCVYSSKHGNEIQAYLRHIQQRFMEREQIEIAAGQTLYGPHKDDYDLSVDGKSLRYFGSRGQQRIGVFIWKYAQLLSLKVQFPLQDTILLVDDLLSELDQHHKQLVCEFLLNHADTQFVITSADKRDVPKTLLAEYQIKLS